MNFRYQTQKGFTLIEILVVIVIIGILATMGIGKYAQFSRDARKSGCVNNQNTIDKGVGMWEAKYMAINTKPQNELYMIFAMNGDKAETSDGLPARLKNTDKFKGEIYDMVQDELIFMCPESVNAYGGTENIKVNDRPGLKDYKWMQAQDGASDSDLSKTNGKMRGVGCLVWGTVAADSTRNDIDGGDGSTGPSGSPDDLHSGKVD